MRYVIPPTIVAAALLLTLPLVMACHATRNATPLTLTPPAAGVRVGTADPISGLELLGPIEGVHGFDCGLYGQVGDYENALIALRNAAARVGAIYVKILTMDEPAATSRDCFDNRFIIRGLAYAGAHSTSGDATSAFTMSPEPAPGGCTPICSPGYACTAGECVPQCNPVCSPGYVCAMDRTCQPGN